MICLCVLLFSDLDVGSGLVRDLHYELAAFAVGLAHQVVEDVQVHSGTQVVDVGHEDVLFPFSDELLQQARVIEAGVDVSVSRWVPSLGALSDHAHVLRHWQQRLLIHPGIPTGWWRDIMSEEYGCSLDIQTKTIMAFISKFLPLLVVFYSPAFSGIWNIISQNEVLYN